MSTERIIDELIRSEIGGVLVTDTEGNVVYSNEKMKCTCRAMDRFMTRIPHLTKVGERKIWEFTNSDADRYFRITSSLKEDEDGKQYGCHCVTDVSELAHLSKNISEYSRKISDFSDFQTKILKVISKPYDSFLPALAELCGSEEVMLRVERTWSRVVAVTTYNGEMKQVITPITEQTNSLFAAKRHDRIDGYRCFMSEEIAERRLIVLIKESPGFSEEYFKDIAVYNVVRLFVENGILREKIIYEGEHDPLTGFYNHQKFNKLAAESFGRPDTVGIYIACVSDLEYMNDHFGNKAGDAILVKATEHILPELDEDLLGFRIGGDKFVVVAKNITEETARNKLALWKERLNNLNKDGDPLRCTVACGMAFGSGDYDVERLLEQADVAMYRDKRRLKEELIKKAVLS